MADDKPTLTRRRVLGGIATVGAAGALGAGTWAKWSDTETVSVSSTAGSLDMRIREVPGWEKASSNTEKFKYDTGEPGVGKWKDGSVLSFNNLMFVPGDVFTKYVEIDNQGTMKGRLSVDITSVSSDEGNSYEPETNTTGDGELDENLLIDVDLRDGDFIEYIPVAQNGYATFQNVMNHSPSYGSRNEEIEDGWTDILRLRLKLPDTTGSSVMGDTLDFDLDLTIEQI